jgi:hypothetical protein
MDKNSKPTSRLLIWYGISAAIGVALLLYANYLLGK